MTRNDAPTRPTATLDPHVLHELLTRIDDELDEPEIEIIAPDDLAIDVEIDGASPASNALADPWFVESAQVGAVIMDRSVAVVIGAPRPPSVYPTYTRRRAGAWVVVALCALAAACAALAVTA